MESHHLTNIIIDHRLYHRITENSIRRNAVRLHDASLFICFIFTIFIHIYLINALRYTLYPASH